MSHFSNFLLGDPVVVSDVVTGHEFLATFTSVYPEGSDKFGLAVVIDQDGDAWDVEPEDIWLDDTDAWDVELDDEHDQFRTDAEADQDALDSVYGADDDGCTCLGDEE